MADQLLEQLRDALEGQIVCYHCLSHVKATLTLSRISKDNVWQR